MQWRVSFCTFIAYSLYQCSIANQYEIRRELALDILSHSGIDYPHIKQEAANVQTKRIHGGKHRCDIERCRRWRHCTKHS